LLPPGGSAAVVVVVLDGAVALPTIQRMTKQLIKMVLDKLSLESQ
jgi:hypothetical protein